MTREEYIDQRCSALLHHWSKIIFLAASLIIIVLIPLDYVAIPEHAHLFLLYRLTTVALLLLLYLINRNKVERGLQNLSVVGAATFGAVMVAFMDHVCHAQNSPYFAAFIVIGIMIGFIPISFRLGVLVQLLIYAIYLVPNLFCDKVMDRSFFLSANILIMAGIFLQLILQYIKGRQTRHEFALEYDRNRAEQDLRDSEERFRAITATAADAIMLIDDQGKITYWNQTAERIFGHTAEEALGQDLHSLICPVRYHEAFQQGFAHFVKTGEGPCLGNTLELPALRKDGDEFPLEITVSGLQLAGRWHAVGIIRDLSEKIKSQAMSRKYASDLEQLVAISHEITITSDLKDLYRTFIIAARDTLALDFSTLMLLSDDRQRLTVMDTLGFPESMIGNFSVGEGQGLASLVLLSKKAEFVRDFERETRFEIPAIAKQKGLRSAIAVPMMMQGEVIGVLVGHTLALREFSASDSTIYQLIGNQAAVAIRNVMNAEIIRRREQYVRDITAALGEGVYVLNQLGNVTFMNPEAEALLGWSEQELLNKNIHDVAHNRRADGTHLAFEDCCMRKVIETGNRFYSAEEVFVRKDGAVFPVSVLSTPLLEQGKIVASVTAFRDISERKRIEREREQLIVELQKAMAEISTLHGIIPICASCKKIRDEAGAWHQLETYISARSDAKFSHGICKECTKKLYPEYYEQMEKDE